MGSRVPSLTVQGMTVSGRPVLGMAVLAMTVLGASVRWVTVLGLTALAASAGCESQVPPPWQQVPAADRAAFEAEAGPLLSKGCGDSKCHGRAERPLRQFAVGRHRMVASEQFSPKPLSKAEWDANFNAILGFVDNPVPRRSTLLRKALGQMAHGGGAVMQAPSDPQFQAVEAWLLGKEW